ncbi:MAG: homoserine dehydrogenase, partial [Dehalococcoidaceae bacterium]|nr:homoserine dehydrogenase [Dehalococcoidaceae bacterium]
MSDSIGISLLGAGNVGGTVLDVLLNDVDRHNKIIGANLKLKHVLVRDLKKYKKNFQNVNFTDDFDEIVNDPETSIVIELMGGENPAKDYISKILKSGKHVVTANKDVMAKYGSELNALAIKHNTLIKYEASVGGGIPIIGPLSRDLLANEISSIAAIINGTTNYMLTLMLSENVGYQDALAQAQKLGYAEPNPINDVEGIDATYKLAILCGLAFHVDVNPSEIYSKGISNIELQDLKYADELGYAIKLLAKADLIDDQLMCLVCPTLILKSEPLSKVDGVLNAIQLKGNLVGQVIFEGPGAGSYATSSAILGDVIDVAKNINRSWEQSSNTMLNKIKVNNTGDFKSRFYIRVNVIDEPGVLATIAGIMSKHSISIASVIQAASNPEKNTAQIVLITHDASQKNIDLALDTISKEKKVDKI